MNMDSKKQKGGVCMKQYLVDVEIDGIVTNRLVKADSPKEAEDAANSEEEE